jgi:hypothetical protein
MLKVPVSAAQATGTAVRVRPCQRVKRQSDERHTIRTVDDADGPRRFASGEFDIARNSAEVASLQLGDNELRIHAVVGHGPLRATDVRRCPAIAIFRGTALLNIRAFELRSPMIG